LLDACLAALPEAAAGLDFDVVVMDNSSADDSVAVARRHPGVTVIDSAVNTGYARGMNQALLYVREGWTPEVLIALNPDTVPPPRSLTRLVEHLMADPTVGLVVPQLTNPDGTLQHSVYRFPSSVITAIICTVPVSLQRGRLARRWWLEGRVAHNEATDIDWAIGAVHALRVSALDGQTPYSERWFMYVEDMDTCWRLHQAGWRIRLEPDSKVLHVGNAAGKQAWGQGRNQRWWEATYDWYRLRHGNAAVRRWAMVNTVGVTTMLDRAKLRRKILRGRARQGTLAEINELQTILPVHKTMVRQPATSYVPPPNT